MNLRPSFGITLLLIVLLALVGCGPKKDKASAVPTQDKATVSAAGASVYSQMQAGDFAKIYQESAPGFKKTGPEAQFVAMMQQFKEKNGPLKSATEVEVKAGPETPEGKFYKATYSLQFEKIQQKQILTFVKPKKGNLALTAIDLAATTN